MMVLKSGELLLAQGFPFDTMNQGFEVSSKPVFATLRANFTFLEDFPTRI